LQKLLYDSDSDDGDNTELTDDIGDADQLGTEVDKYFTSLIDCEELKPLQRWKSQALARRLPKLSLAARSVCAIPATHNKSERGFSGAGHVVTDLRSTTDFEHVDDLLLGDMIVQLTKNVTNSC
jgi:hypothetical protein